MFNLNQQFRNQISKSLKEAISIPLTHKYNRLISVLMIVEVASNGRRITWEQTSPFNYPQE